MVPLVSHSPSLSSTYLQNMLDSDTESSESDTGSHEDPAFQKRRPTSGKQPDAPTGLLSQLLRGDGDLLPPQHTHQSTHIVDQAIFPPVRGQTDSTAGERERAGPSESDHPAVFKASPAGKKPEVLPKSLLKATQYKAISSAARGARKRDSAALSPPHRFPAPAPSISPRTARRQMLTTEMSESLRRNLLWERQVNHPGGMTKPPLHDLARRQSKSRPDVHDDDCEQVGGVGEQENYPSTSPRLRPGSRNRRGKERPLNTLFPSTWRYPAHIAPSERGGYQNSAWRRQDTRMLTASLVVEVTPLVAHGQVYAGSAVEDVYAALRRHA